MAIKKQQPESQISAKARTWQDASAQIQSRTIYIYEGEAFGSRAPAELIILRACVFRIYIVCICDVLGGVHVRVGWICDYILHQVLVARHIWRIRFQNWPDGCTVVR